MERSDLSRLGCTYHHRQRTQQEISPIVDDPKSSNPHLLLPWLKRRLQMLVPINNTNYHPTLPTAS